MKRFFMMNIMAIVGSCLSSNTLAMVPITDKAKLTHSVVSSSTPKLSGISPYFFRMAVQDAQVATNPDPSVQAFVKKYKEKYNMEPDTFAALGYDQMYVIAKAMEKAAEKGTITRESVREAMSQTNYKGVTGTVTFDDKGDWVRPYLYITVRDGQFVVYQ